MRIEHGPEGREGKE